MKKIIINALGIIALITSSCTSDYEEINTDRFGLSEEELSKGGVLNYGSSFLQLQKSVIPIGAPAEKTGPGNDLQITDLISSGNYIGYFGNNNNWGFRIESNWNFEDGRMSYANTCFYSKLFTSWVAIKQAIGNSENIQEQRAMAIANIVKITGWLRATDVFGPIVYSNAGKGEITPSLDKQEDVYKAMLEELDKCIETLQNDVTVMADYDVIYGGSTAKWKKFASSLMLRMAVRSHFVNQTLANTYIAKALDYGVMDNPSDEAKIGNTSTQPLLNPMLASIGYQETRMGLTIWSYLTGYEDTRISKYFKKGTYNGQQDFYGVAPTSKLQKYENRNTAAFASEPNVDNNSPVYWMRASEVLFLKAEAALYNLGGLSSSQAQGFYEEGVRMSFQENAASMPTNYLTSTNKPATLPFYNYDPSYNYDLSNNNISPSWTDVQFGSEEEEHLQKIITQKYLAMYPNAVEAWTEYRRTGYPLVMKYHDTQAPNRIGCSTCFVPERFKYSAKDYLTNSKLQTEVPNLLGGQDTGATRLWWVRPNRPQQQ